MSLPRPIRVAIAAYDGVSLLDLSGPLEALRLQYRRRVPSDSIVIHLHVSPGLIA